MTELELFGYAIIAVTGICATVWLLVVACIVISVLEHGKRAWQWWTA